VERGAFKSGGACKGVLNSGGHEGAEFPFCIQVSSQNGGGQNWRVNLGRGFRAVAAARLRPARAWTRLACAVPAGGLTLDFLKIAAVQGSTRKVFMIS
jgi:hypothetical protein